MLTQICLNAAWMLMLFVIWRTTMLTLRGWMVHHLTMMNRLATATEIAVKQQAELSEEIRKS